MWVAPVSTSVSDARVSPDGERRQTRKRNARYTVPGSPDFDARFSTKSDSVDRCVKSEWLGTLVEFVNDGIGWDVKVKGSRWLGWRSGSWAHSR